MSGEMIAIVAVGVALAGVILTSNRGLRQDMARLESRLREDMKQLYQSAWRGWSIGQAKLEGLLEGLREAIGVRSAQQSRTQP